MNLVSASPAESDIDWYKNELKSSAISETMADHAGFRLQAGRYLIPYFTRDGAPTEFIKAKLRVPVVLEQSGTGYAHEKGGKESKYITVLKPKTGGLLPYWPKIPTVNHNQLLASSTHELWVVEGEKKAISAQCCLLSVGISASVVGLGGVNVVDSLIADIPDLRYSTEVDGTPIHRRVVLALDWGTDNPDVVAAEIKLARYFKELGATVLVLRWNAPAGVEQKIDDYIAAGGSIEDAIKYSEALGLDPAADAEAPLRAYNERFAKMGGEIVELATGTILSYSRARVQLAHETIPVVRGKRVVLVPIIEEWISWPDVRLLDGLVMEPWPFGVAAQRLTDDNKLNIFTGWPPSPPWDIELSTKVWDAHLDHLFSDPFERQWVTCWIANIVQHPAAVCSTYLALVSRIQGTGKGLFVRTLERMLGGALCTAGTREAWVGRFNGDWSGKLLVVTDELQAHNKREAVLMGESIKRVVGSKNLSIERKGMDTLSVLNTTHHVFCGNLDNITYLEDGDRRAFYSRSTRPLPPAMADALAAFLAHPDSQVALLQWAMRVDLSDWDACAPAPRTQAKLDSIAANTDGMAEFVASIGEWAHKDIYTTQEMVMIYEQIEGDTWRSGARNFVPSFRRYGIITPPPMGNGLVKVKGVPLRLWCVRNHEEWANRQAQEWAVEYAKIAK